MPFSRCRQSIGRAFARPPHSAAVGSANAHALAKFATGDIMRTPSMARSCGSISSRARSPRAVKIRSIGPAFPAARSRCPRPRDRAAATGQRHVEKTHCCNMAFHCRTMEADQPPAAIAAPALSSPACGEGKDGGEPAPRPPQTVPPAASASPPWAKSGEPDRVSRDSAEIERIMIVMEKVWRRLVEMMMGIRRDLHKKG